MRCAEFRDLGGQSQPGTNGKNRRSGTRKHRRNATTTEDREIFRRRGHRRRPLWLMQPVLRRRHQQIGSLGERDDEQGGAADVESRIDVADVFR
jgi:hypothetical protein